MNKKIQPWLDLRGEKRPPMGWLKAIRGALGMTAQQLGRTVGVDASSILRLEERELTGKLTLELLNRAAQAMDCKVVYAIVPNEGYESLEATVEKRARKVAKEILQKVEHSMKLEDQGSPDSTADLEKLTQELKEKMDPRIWGLVKKKKAHEPK